MNWKATIATVAITVGVGAGLMIAQDAGDNGGDQGRQRQREPGQDGNGQDRGSRGDRMRNWDPAEMQKRMMERFKEQMKVPDDEWAIIQPKLQKVLDAQRDLRGGGMMGGFVRRGGDDANRPQDTSPVATASRELRTVLEQENASAEQINAKLAAYREARAKAQANLDAARKDLKDVLSARQEAVLVMVSILE